MTDLEQLAKHVAVVEARNRITARDSVFDRMTPAAWCDELDRIIAGAVAKVLEEHKMAMRQRPPRTVVQGACEVVEHEERTQ